MIGIIIFVIFVVVLLTLTIGIRLQDNGVTRESIGKDFPFFVFRLINRDNKIQVWTILLFPFIFVAELFMIMYYLLTFRVK